MTPRLLETNNRMFRIQNIRVRKMAQLRLSKSKWKQIEVDTTAAKDHMRRAEAMATMSTARTRGMLILNRVIPHLFF